MDTDLIQRDTLWNLITLVSALLIILNIREIYNDFFDSGKALYEGKYLDFIALTYEKRKVPKSTVRTALSFILFLVLMLLAVILFIQKDYLPLNTKENLQKTHKVNSHGQI